MYLKSKNFPRLGLVFLLAILAIDPGVAMSESTEDSNQLKITQTIIHEIISTLPLSIEKICVLEVLPDQSLKPLELQYLDNRIVIDHSICGDPRSTDPSKITIMYVKDVKTGIRQTEKPSGQSSEIYDKIVKHINEGNLVAMAGLAKCSADMKFYVFKIGQDGPQLIESAAIGSMQCLSK